MKTILVIFVAFIALLGFSPSADAQLGYGVEYNGATQLIAGYAWNENIGWINFNGTGYSVQKQGISDVLAGYAWSENVGWLSFNATDVAGCPVTPCEARIDTSTGKISGWAKFLSATAASGNKGGLVRFGYENTTDPNPSFQGDYAWSEDFGWIHLNSSSTPASNARLIICPINDTVFRSSSPYEYPQQFSAIYHADSDANMDCSNYTGYIGWADVTLDAQTTWATVDGTTNVVDPNFGSVKGNVIGWEIDLAGKDIKASYNGPEGLVEGYATVVVGPKCGNGETEASGAEVCDDGAEISGVCPDSVCNGDCPGCNATCSEYLDASACTAPVSPTNMTGGFLESR